MDIAIGKSTNTIKGDQYSSHLKLSDKEKELVYDSLSELILMQFIIFWICFKPIQMK